MDSQDTITSFTKAIEDAMLDYESAVKAHLVNVANKASILQSFYSSTRFKQDKYDYREALRHDLDVATTVILRMRKHISDQKPSGEGFEKVLFQPDEDFNTSMVVVNELLNVKEYDWIPYLQLMNEVKERVFLNLNHLSDDERKIFLQSPLVIELGDGDVRSWRAHSQGSCKSTKNLIRQTQNLVKELARSKKTPVMIELVKISEFRMSIFCCSCHFWMRVRGRSVICAQLNSTHELSSNFSPTHVT
ncbi:hypothetical protein BGW38_009443 [Lunasporangiospora selenospora]|uniref:Uncharacterized protein n=1 Tax=Lunasporangiospora selenospora TaxID=979761 RepID=A0A9P6FZB2_9FUNG|nr:hypothetical protein BGW38_009443 [Lunasporangiospora selenospora]